MKKEIKLLKQVKLQKDVLLKRALDLELEIKRLEDLLHSTKMKQSKCAYEIEQVNKKAFDLIAEL